jgi:hypothetical protein
LKIQYLYEKHECSVLFDESFAVIFQPSNALHKFPTGNVVGKTTKFTLVQPFQSSHT